MTTEFGSGGRLLQPSRWPELQIVPCIAAAEMTLMPNYRSLSRGWLVAAMSLFTWTALQAEDEPNLFRSAVLIAQPDGVLHCSAGKGGEGATRYWADPGRGTVRKLVDGKAEDIASDTGLSYGLAFDAPSQAFFWTDSERGQVTKLAVEAKRPVALVSSFEEPYALDVSTAETKIAYLIEGQQLLRLSQSVESDVEQREELVRLPDDFQYHGLAFDSDEQALLIGDANGMMVFRVSLRKPDLTPLCYDDEPFEPR